MSTLETNFIKHLATGDQVGAEYVVLGSAKAWISMNNAAAIQESFNVSSTTDYAANRWQTNYNNLMVNNEHSPTATSNIFGVNGNVVTNIEAVVYYYTRVRCNSSDGGYPGSEPTRVYHSTFGELA